MKQKPRRTRGKMVNDRLQRQLNSAALLAAWWEGMADMVAPVCMTGTGNSIHPDALHYFAGKHVRIATHLDANQAGLKADLKWTGQLYAAGAADVDSFDFAGLLRRNGQPVEDLADFATLIDPELPAPCEVFQEFHPPLHDLEPDTGEAAP